MVSLKTITALSFFHHREKNDCKINNRNCLNTQCAPPTVTNVFKTQNTNRPTCHKKRLNAHTKYTKLDVFKYKIQYFVFQIRICIF